MAKSKTAEAGQPSPPVTLPLRVELPTHMLGLNQVSANEYVLIECLLDEKGVTNIIMSSPMSFPMAVMHIKRRGAEIWLQTK